MNCVKTPKYSHTVHARLQHNVILVNWWIVHASKGSPVLHKFVDTAPINKVQVYVYYA